MTPRQLGIKTAMSEDMSQHVSQGAAGGLGGAAGVAAGLGTFGRLGAMGQKAEDKLPQFMSVLGRNATSLMTGEPNAIPRAGRIAQMGGSLSNMARLAKHRNLLAILAGLGTAGATTGAAYGGLRALTAPRQ